jgi:hypothetical protein
MKKGESISRFYNYFIRNPSLIIFSETTFAISVMVCSIFEGLTDLVVPVHNSLSGLTEKTAVSTK